MMKLGQKEIKESVEAGFSVPSLRTTFLCSPTSWRQYWMSDLPEVMPQSDATTRSRIWFPPLGLSLLDEHSECEDTGQNPHRAKMLSNSSKEKTICSLSPQMKLRIQLNELQDYITTAWLRPGQGCPRLDLSFLPSDTPWPEPCSRDCV